MQKLTFYSTNRQSPEVYFSQALFQGQAPDRGLYMPGTIPVFQSGELRTLVDGTYPEIASYVLWKYLEGVFSKNELDRHCAAAYPFDVPLERIDGCTYVLRLDQGPTASFKDFAARLMARFMGALRPSTDRKLVVLTATSGDTGSAIAHAFFKVPGIDVVVLFPPDEVSTRQRKQMTTLGENITALGIDGKFDDCQALVKQAFSDPELDSIELSSANSINIGRLLPQIVYYVYASIRLGLQPLVFAIPSGNFGNTMGALLAKRMEVPIQKLLVATNANDEVPVYLSTATYRKIVPSRNCISNAMNVGHPSNFARVVDFYGGWMDETGTIRRPPNLEAMRHDVWTDSIGDEETRRAIRNVWQKHRLMLEPHGAVGWAGLERYRKNTGYSGIAVLVETAHPAKFPEEIGRLLGLSPEVPESLSEVETKMENVIPLPADYGQFRQFLSRRFAR